VNHIADQLLGLTQHFLSELKAERAARAVHLDAQLEKELGIGSLEKAELISRIEKTFDIRCQKKCFLKHKPSMIFSLRFKARNLPHTSHPDSFPPLFKQQW